MPIGTNLWQALKAFNQFRIIKNETMEMFSIGERRKSKHKFGGIKFCEGEEVREYFINPKTENIFFFLD